ncbi:22.0 kDa class IV heat shock protein [Acorus calamus]|uniref:22.0 kDa class IV heat shock protein n=1 Tax=Acorus calamus TaxID=4465 RepID=A0AAV9EGG1_ACOCL|nr:22.0 kDa class IV heat shock protein [Acorus calamus]
MEDILRRRRELPKGAQEQNVYEDFQPPLDWTSDANSHVLLIDLAGFKREEVRVQVDSTGKLTVSGERRAGDTKYKRFKIVADVPKDSNLEKITGRFEHDLEGVVDVVLDKINRNRRVIVVAVAAFTIGFYVSRRLRSAGG